MRVRVAVLGVVALVLAACSGSSATVASPSPQPTAAAVQTAATPMAAASQGGGGTSADCASLKPAMATINLDMQLLAQVTSAEQWTALAGPDAVVKLDPREFASAVEQVAALPGTADAVAALRKVAALFGRAAASGNPFTDGSGVGPDLQKAVTSAFVDAQSALLASYDAAGCH